MLGILISMIFNANFQSERMFIQSIANGNTINMIANGRNYRVRLCGVNVPANQNEQAVALLTSLTKKANEQDKPLVVVPITKHQSNIVAEVFAPTSNPDEEKFVNGELLLAGLGQLTNESCPNRDVLVSVQEEAQSSRIGMWREQSNRK